ncbi:MAG: VanW family protein [Bacteroidota bacterium]
MSLRSYIPPGLRLYYQLARRRWRDYRSGMLRTMRLSPTNRSDWPHQISLQQAIRPSHLYENKISNLQIASRRIAAVAILPGQTLSYWRWVGAPTAAKGFKKGRNLIAGQLREDYGGGLCQLSGIMYHLALMAGLEIVERHHHSFDIYTEESRYTPLGADATVVYGYKDLRIRNSTRGALHFTFEITNDQLNCILQSTHPLKAEKVYFQCDEKQGQTLVKTINADGKVLAQSCYKV